MVTMHKQLRAEKSDERKKTLKQETKQMKTQDYSNFFITEMTSEHNLQNTFKHNSFLEFH